RYRIAGDDEINVEEARRRAKAISADASKGVNPQAAKRDARIADQRRMTFKSLFEQYIEKHAKPHKRTWQEDEAQYKRHLKGWAHRRVDSITIDDVERLHAKIGKTAPYAANRLLALLSAVFNSARGLAVNPTKGVRRY